MGIQLSLSVGLYGQHLILPAGVCDNKHGVLSTREAHLSLGVQGFYWDPVMETWLTACVADLSPAPLEVKLMLSGPRPT